MKRLLSKLALLTFILILFNCGNGPNPGPDTVTEQGVTNKMENFKVSLSEARAILSNGAQDPTQSNARVNAERKTIKELKTFSNENNEIVLYVSNYEKNQGWTVLSGDRRLKPVLAYSDDGEFNLDSDNPGLKYWLDLVKRSYKDVQKEEKASPDVSFLWKSYDSGSRPDKSGRIATACPADMVANLPPPIEVFHLTDQYSNWSQGAGYNFFCPAGLPNLNCGFACDNAPTGCGPVAAAQVLRYHRKEVTIDGFTYTPAIFDAMPRTVASTCNLTGENPLNVARLLRGVGKGLNAKYNSTIFGTGISITGCQTWNLPGNIDNFFSDLGFTSYDRDFDSNRALLQGQLINGNPVIVYGASCDVCFGSMHIWVIDGIRKSAALIPLEEPNCIDEPNEINQPNARTTGRVCCYQSEFISYQMNWGWGGGQNNGWYSLPIHNSGTTYNNSGMKMYIVNP